jgi:HAD superfamily hydrolase (TIGR01509 family)
MPPAVEKPAWSLIDTVLLDLDGTLLDLAFDNHFWREVIPSAYAASRSLTLEQARALLQARFLACEGTLSWYCVEHWTRELELDVLAIKRTVADRVAWLPGAQDFLRGVRAAGKRIVLLTNSHPEVLQIKDERTLVSSFLDAAFSSHEFGAPKENPAFWQAVRKAEPFDLERTLFVDDSPPVLRAARAAGVRWVYGVRAPSTAASGPAAERRDHEDFPAVDSIVELAPEIAPAPAGQRLEAFGPR